MRNALTIAMAATLLTTTGPGCAAGNAEDKRATGANAQSRWTPTEGEPQLAFEVEVTAEGVKPVGPPTIVRAPRKPSTGQPDLRVTVSATSGKVAEYDIADPRIAETEDGKRMVLPAARTFVYAPLSADLKELAITPARARPEAGPAPSATVPLAPLLGRACEAHKDLAECRKVLERQPR